MLICVILIVFLISIPIVNDYTAEQVAEHLEEIPLPQNTELIESTSGASKYTGNGNGMQYLGCILLKSESDIEELRNYYSSYAQNEWDCLVEEQKGKNIEFIEHGTLSFNTETGDGKYYIVYSWGDGIDLYSALDIRGH